MKQIKTGLNIIEVKTRYFYNLLILIDLPYKLLTGGELLPDTPAWDGERREERLWKCITRKSNVLDKWSRARLFGVLSQVEEKLSRKNSVCQKKVTGLRGWVRRMTSPESLDPITVANNMDTNQ